MRPYGTCLRKKDAIVSLYAIDSPVRDKSQMWAESRLDAWTEFQQKPITRLHNLTVNQFSQAYAFRYFYFINRTVCLRLIFDFSSILGLVLCTPTLCTASWWVEGNIHCCLNQDADIQFDIRICKPRITHTLTSKKWTEPPFNQPPSLEDGRPETYEHGREFQIDESTFHILLATLPFLRF